MNKKCRTIYKKLSLKFHPDKFKTNDNLFTYINASYENNNYDEVFSEPNDTNPLGNVLMTEIHDESKKPAPPAYNQNVQSKIIDSAKQMVQKTGRGN